MIMAAILSIVIVTTVAVALGPQAWTDTDTPAARLTPEATSPERRRRVTRRSGIRHSARTVRPQYLPALARARILRSQVSYLEITTQLTGEQESSQEDGGGAQSS
jgi:hypothetical protein